MRPGHGAMLRSTLMRSRHGPSEGIQARRYCARTAAPIAATSPPRNTRARGRSKARPASDSATEVLKPIPDVTGSCACKVPGSIQATAQNSAVAATSSAPASLWTTAQARHGAYSTGWECVSIKISLRFAASSMNDAGSSPAHDCLHVKKPVEAYFLIGRHFAE